MGTFKQHVERAISLKGSQAKLASDMGCSQQYISWLLKEADQVSAEKAIAFELATDGAVKRYELRPDIFPSPDRETAA